MYTMVLMMAVGGSADATAFGGRKGCSGAAVSSCSGSGYVTSGCSGYLPTYTGCTGYSSCSGYAPSTGCTGSKHGFLGGLFHHKSKSSSCHGTVVSSGCYGGCSGYIPAPTCCPTPAPTCCATPAYYPAPVAAGCFGSAVASPIMIGGPAPVMGGMPMGAAPATTAPEAMPAAPTGTTPPVTSPEKPAPAPEKPAPAPGTKL